MTDHVWLRFKNPAPPWSHSKNFVFFIFLDIVNHTDFAHFSFFLSCIFWDDKKGNYVFLNSLCGLSHLANHIIKPGTWVGRQGFIMLFGINLCGCVNDQHHILPGCVTTTLLLQAFKLKCLSIRKLFILCLSCLDVCCCQYTRNTLTRKE